MFAQKAFFLFLIFPFFSLFAQEGSLPAELLRPKSGEAPRFPKDYWIGELGRGEAGEEAYRAARRMMGRIVNGDVEGFPEEVKRTAAGLKGLEIRSTRVGGGRNEADGSVSFLVRFLGREEAVAGEIYLSPPAAAQEDSAAQTWRLDDFFLEKRRPLSEGLYGPGGADLTPYERFF